MKLSRDLPSVLDTPVPKVPAWARVHRDISSDVDAGYLAGAALNSLDSLVRSELIWNGVWRQRLALRSSVMALRFLGKHDEESELRDAHVFRASGDDAGPSGRVLLAWRRLAERSTSLNEETVRHVADLLEVGWDDAISEVVANAEDTIASPRPAPVLAGYIAAELYRARPDAEGLALWLADAVLAQKMRWPVPVPLLASQALSSVFKSGESRRRVRPGGDGWGRAVILAYAKAAADACDLGVDLANRAERLLAVEPKLRSKAAGDVIRLLLNEDATPASWSSSKLSARGARRLFERLQELGAVRELSGRTTFRLYGL